jgi:lysophospholipase L1-like esterase
MNGRRFANAFLLAGASISAAASLFALRSAMSHGPITARASALAVGPLLLAVALLLALKLSVDRRIALAVTCLSLALAAYAAECYLRQLPEWRMKRSARQYGMKYDGRSKIEVLRDLRRDGVDAWPAMAPELLFGSHDPNFLPLGGISNVVTVSCNELGSYLIYRSDEHGFHNPPGLWSSPALEVAAVGDSYTQGRCVPSEQNMVALIRKKYPATLNLGMSGNGPLTELADVLEYLTPLQPRRVLWFYYEGNDLTDDLPRDRSDPTLARYLEPGFRQDFLSRQAEIDSFLKRRVEDKYLEAEQRFLARQTEDRWQGALRLRTLRAALGLAVWKHEESFAGIDYPLFHRILRTARDAARTWDGRVYFIYLPASGRYLSGDLRRLNDEVRDKVFAILCELDIPLIDLSGPFGRERVDDLYAPNGGHFTPKGYDLAAERVLQAIDGDRR